MLLDHRELGAWRWLLGGTALLLSLFLLLPLLLIVALSFDSSQWLQFPPPSWTLHWYAQVFADPDWLSSLRASLEVGVSVTVLSVGIGLCASFALVRGRFRGRAFLRAFFVTPMILPSVVLAVALYGVFLRLHLNGTLAGFVLAHLVLALPFSIIPITSALEQFDGAVEDAAL